MFQGHRHIFDEELYQRVGHGVEGMMKKMLTPGREHPQVKGLWLNFGRIQMLNMGAQRLAWGIAKDLQVSGGEMDQVDAKESWSMFLGKHALVTAGGYWWWNSRNHVKSKL